MTPEHAERAAPTLETTEPEGRRTISLLGIRRRYWELTHGWSVPARSPDTLDNETPGRVA
ncbi:MAG: hypothetical protein R2853_19085 [Thermomicrobiales bacterium]|nr:hypothetical protein [Thermomicrobiales bacterium]